MHILCLFPLSPPPLSLSSPPLEIQLAIYNLNTIVLL